MMKIFRFKSLTTIFVFSFFAFWLFLVFPYIAPLVKYHSLSGSGLVYSLKDREPLGGETTVIKPVSTRFALVIGKLGLNEKVVGRVDFYDEGKLETALAQGLAHVGTSALPGDFGAVLIVGHPLYSLFNFGHFNPAFYLVGKLEINDEIVLIYNGFEFSYQVKSKGLVGPDYLDFFEPGEERKLVLVSGYPVGMAVKFLVVEAEPAGFLLEER